MASGTTWSQDELATLHSLLDRGLMLREIAEAMQPRTLRAVSVMLNRIGRRTRHSAGDNARAWTYDDDATLVPFESLTRQQQIMMARRLGW
jgi:hypothetical protein